MTRDEAMAIYKKADRAGEEAYFGIRRPGSDDDNEAREAGLIAAATVIQQAFAERDGEIERLCDALERISQWSDRAVMQPACAIDMRDTARQALAAKGDSRG